MKNTNWTRAQFLIVLCAVTFNGCHLFESAQNEEPLYSSPPTETPVSPSAPLSPLLPENPTEKAQEEKPEETVEHPVPPPKPFKRTIISLFDSKQKLIRNLGALERTMELPLNYLGYIVEYADLSHGLPDLSKREDVLGILVWFPPDYSLDNINHFIIWALNQIDEGRKIVLCGTILDIAAQRESPLIEELWSRLGILETTSWSSLTYEYELGPYNPKLYPFEAELPPVLPGFMNFAVIPEIATVQLALKSKTDPSKVYPIIVTSPNGAFVYEEYLKIYDNTTKRDKFYLNPFELLKVSFDLKPHPIPDPTTLAGRRIYYSQIDGDGWNNITYAIKENPVNPIYSSEVIMDRIITQTSDLPVTIGPIAADINLNWFGTKKSQTIAEELFKLNHVEIGCHTFTHPFDWQFFKNYTADKEKPYLSHYPTKTFDDRGFGFLKKFVAKPSSYYALQTEGDQILEKNERPLEEGYVIPRAFALEPFSLDLEVLGAINEVNLFAPSDKKVEIYQWSGNGNAFEEAVALTVKAGVQNINGANVRLDFSFPSYSNVDAMGVKKGSYYQIFNSNSNENNYTSLWTKNFFGFVTLPRTFAWTETPIRIKPIDLYYHMYSGERLASLNALIKNIEYIRQQKIAPVFASTYTKFVDGFYSSRIIPLGEDGWLIENRGSLQTFRFDRAVFKSVDVQASRGVIGFKHLHGSLYVSLDSAVENPLIMLKESENSAIEPLEELPYLIDSRWQISAFNIDTPSSFAFTVQGFGKGEMEWKVPEEGTYQLKAHSETGQMLHEETVTARNHTLFLNLDFSAIYPVRITLDKEVQRG